MQYFVCVYGAGDVSAANIYIYIIYRDVGGGGDGIIILLVLHDQNRGIAFPVAGEKPVMRSLVIILYVRCVQRVRTRRRFSPVVFFRCDVTRCARRDNIRILLYFPVS